MSVDSYGPYETQARCAGCGKFMPWERSVLKERSDGMPSPSPVYIEIGLCASCFDEKAKTGQESGTCTFPA